MQSKMMKILHIASECYPAAKAGGLGDVVGALPKYLPNQNVEASVIIPKYRTNWLNEQSFETIYTGSIDLAGEQVIFEVMKLTSKVLDYPFYCIEIPGKFDREGIYLNEYGVGYDDEIQRNLSFQRAVLEFILNSDLRFDGIHCHDHMTGMVPFMMANCSRYEKLKNIPTFLTMHNGVYQGVMPWHNAKYIEPFYPNKWGLLDWDHSINSLGAAIKCAWEVTTVSMSYLEEMQSDPTNPLSSLIIHESSKCHGILNGIDVNEWDPSSDRKLDHKFSGDWKAFKSKNKNTLRRITNIRKESLLI
jgi:starch synthase